MTMSIFHRILFAGDLSDRSRGAFGAACSFAGQSGADLHVLHVVDSRESREEIEDQLRAFYRAAPPLAVHYLTRRGDAPDAILRTADELEADLIVVGTHGRSGLDRMLYGSVAESVMQRSSRPVLVVRQTDVSRTTKPIRIVLHPIDFSGSSRPALDVARALAQSHRARLVLLHSEPAGLGPERAELAPLQEPSDRAGLHVTVETRFGPGEPVTEILQATRDLHCDLIVLGSHGRIGFPRFMLGSVAESVIREAPCLTLVVKGAPVASPSLKAEDHPVAQRSGATA
jgi:nucleotide-binding universal stress UspA family protein